MPPILALILWFILLVALFRFDPAKDRNASLALWVPVIWMFLLGSRNASQFFTGDIGFSAQAFEEGNPFDRAVDLLLILTSLGILFSRSFKWGTFFTRNWALTACLVFSLLSVCWSDFPFIAFKRWFRDLESYFAVFIILSDPRPVEASRTVLRRVCYLLVPLSVVLDKYFPNLSKSYDAWSGIGHFSGVATSKNMLGLLCLISALFFFWDTVTEWHDRRRKITQRRLIVNLAFLAMTLWLLHTAQSTTSTVCFGIGCAVICSFHSKILRRHPKFLKALVPAGFLLYIVLNFGLGLNGSLAEAVGKDPTLTDRTKIWAFLLGMHTNPIIGTGYQSFWLGPRLEWFWNNAQLGHLNEAHNGYLEMYLEQGTVGLVLLLVFLFSSYRGLLRRTGEAANFAIFTIAVEMVLLFYNMSEAAFAGGLLFTVFLLGGISLPQRAKSRVQKLGSAAERMPANGFTNVAVETPHVR